MRPGDLVGRVVERLDPDVVSSRLELTRLLYADFDRGTEVVLAQPFLLSDRVDGGKRRHVPDFLILRRGRVPPAA